MDSPRVMEPTDLDPAAVAVVDSYLTTMAGRLPRHARLLPDVLAEMREDLLTAAIALTPESPGAVAAARAAVAEFGDAEAIAEALRPELAARQSRRFGKTLLLTGPLVGACWLAAVFLGAGHAVAWRWLLVLVAPIIVIGAPATELTVASTGWLSRWLRPGNGLTEHALTVAGVAAGLGDLLLLVGCGTLLLVSGPPHSPLFLLAVLASCVRLALLVRAAGRFGPWVRVSASRSV